jgi:hypothetical protein
MVMPMKKDCKNSPNKGPTSICIMLDCSMESPMSFTRVLPLMMPLEFDTTCCVTSNTAMMMSKVLDIIQTEVSNIFENSDFVYMLNQANGDRQILAKQLNISPHQLSYVTHSGEGEGLLFFGNVILPFVDHFPKDLELYRILTTRLSEVAEAQKHE